MVISNGPDSIRRIIKSIIYSVISSNRPDPIQYILEHVHYILIYLQPHQFVPFKFVTSIFELLYKLISLKF